MAWYLAAALAGLRRGDLVRLTWADVDFEEGSITIRAGKAKRVDVLPLHPQLADELMRLRPLQLNSTSKVFPTAVASRTQQKDFERAGIGPDDQGRVADLHALRATLGTQLARQGVAPQVAQKIMRHGDYRTTLRHYTVLGLADTTQAINQLPMVGERVQEVRTGTSDGGGKGGGASTADAPRELAVRTHARCQQIRQQSEHETVHSGAAACDEGQGDGGHHAQHKPPLCAGVSDTVRPHASKRVTGLEPATFSLGS